MLTCSMVKNQSLSLQLWLGSKFVCKTISKNYIEIMKK